MINISAIRYKLEYQTLKFINRNNSKTRMFQQEGFEFLQGRVDKLPVEMVFRPRFITQSSCVKVFDKIYLFISKANLYKPESEKPYGKKVIQKKLRKMYRNTPSVPMTDENS